MSSSAGTANQHSHNPVDFDVETTIKTATNKTNFRRLNCRPIGSPGKKPILHIASGGGPVGGYVPSPLLAQGINVNHYCKIKIDGPKFLLTVHVISSAVIDRFELVNDDAQRLSKTAVETQHARELIGLYQELLTDRTFELRLSTAKSPTPKMPVELILDLPSLPRGPLDTTQFDADETLFGESTRNCEWKIPHQSFRLRDGIGLFQASALSPLRLAAAGRSQTRSCNWNYERAVEHPSRCAR